MHLTRLCLVIVAVRLVACGPAPGDPRADIQALLARAEQAAEAGDVEVLAATLHPDFVDDYGRDRRAVVFMLKSLMARYARTEIVLRDIVIDVLSPRLANAELTVVAVARDASRPLLTGFDADRQRLRIALRADGDGWRVTRAEWFPAGED